MFPQQRQLHRAASEALSCSAAHGTIAIRWNWKAAYHAYQSNYSDESYSLSFVFIKNSSCPCFVLTSMKWVNRWRINSRRCVPIWVWIRRQCSIWSVRCVISMQLNAISLSGKSPFLRVAIGRSSMTRSTFQRSWLGLAITMCDSTKKKIKEGKSIGRSPKAMRKSKRDWTRSTISTWAIISSWLCCSSTTKRLIHSRLFRNCWEFRLENYTYNFLHCVDRNSSSEISTL